MSKITTKFKVVVYDLEIDNEYYSFDYVIYKNGEEYCNGSYESDHCWQGDLGGLREMLEEGEAVDLALQQELGG